MLSNRPNKLYPLTEDSIQYHKSMHAKVKPGVSMMNKTQIIEPRLSSQSKNSDKRHSLGSNKPSSSAIKIKHIKAKLVKRKETRNSQNLKQVSYNEYFAQKHTKDNNDNKSKAISLSEIKNKNKDSSVFLASDSGSIFKNSNSKNSSYERPAPDLLLKVPKTTKANDFSMKISSKMPYHSPSFSSIQKSMVVPNSSTIK